MKHTCFQLYFQPVYAYIKGAFELAADNNFALAISSTTLVGLLHVLEEVFKIEIFGIPNVLLFCVIFTILTDAYFGTKRSLKEARVARDNAAACDPLSPDFRRWQKVAELKKFKPEKLQFTFFKCLTLLAYLFFAKTLLLADQDGAFSDLFGFASSLILKAPLAIFWYYDFKSIGNNAAYLHGKKAPIFTIVERIFELKLKKHLTPSQNDIDNQI